eukprot:8570004-Alexandrium_andersonii.AAC.1
MIGAASHVAADGKLAKACGGACAARARVLLYSGFVLRRGGGAPAGAARTCGADGQRPRYGACVCVLRAHAGWRRRVALRGSTGSTSR